MVSGGDKNPFFHIPDTSTSHIDIDTFFHHKGIPHPYSLPRSCGAFCSQFLPPFPPPIAGCQSGIRKRYRPSGFPRLRISGSCPGFFGVVMLSGSTAHTCAPCGLPASIAGAFSRSLPLPFPAVACFPAPKGLRLAELGTCGERPPGEACGTLGRGPCSRPFPVCVRLFCYVKITLSRSVFL